MTNKNKLFEILTKKDKAGKWIKDFVKSDAPQFKGKSKKKKIQMALAAYYSKQNEEVEQIQELNPSAGRLPTKHAEIKDPKKTTWDQMTTAGKGYVPTEFKDKLANLDDGSTLKLDDDLRAKRIGDKLFFNKPGSRTKRVVSWMKFSEEKSPEYKYNMEKDKVINEALRLHKTLEHNGRKAKIYKDNEWGEHRVKFYTHGKHHKNADYHTDDPKDAHDTAKHWLHKMNNEAVDVSMDTRKAALGAVKKNTRGFTDSVKHREDEGNTAADRAKKIHAHLKTMAKYTPPKEAKSETQKKAFGKHITDLRKAAKAAEKNQSSRNTTVSLGKHILKLMKNKGVSTYQAPVTPDTSKEG